MKTDSFVLFYHLLRSVKFSPQFNKCEIIINSYKFIQFYNNTRETSVMNYIAPCLLLRLNFPLRIFFRD